MKELVLSNSFLGALDVLGDVFAHPWRRAVSDELQGLLSSRKPVTGTALTNKLMVVLRQGCRLREGLFECFSITPYQVQFSSPDRRYQVTLQQGETGKTLSIWRIYSRKAGANSFSFTVSDDHTWLLGKIRVSPACTFNLPLLADVGGEVLGYFALRALFPEQSPLHRAVVEHIEATDVRGIAAKVSDSPMHAD